MFLFALSTASSLGCYLDPHTAAAIRESDRIELAVPDIVQMLREKVSDPVILTKARYGGVATLSAGDIVTLKKAGASDGLVQELIRIGSECATSKTAVH